MRHFWVFAPNDSVSYLTSYAPVSESDILSYEDLEPVACFDSFAEAQSFEDQLNELMRKAK